MTKTESLSKSGVPGTSLVLSADEMSGWVQKIAEKLAAPPGTSYLLMQNFGMPMRLQKARKDRRLTLVKLVTMCNSTVRVVGRLEKESAGVSLDLLVRLSAALSVDPVWLYSGAPDSIGVPGRVSCDKFQRAAAKESAPPAQQSPPDALALNKASAPAVIEVSGGPEGAISLKVVDAPVQIQTAPLSPAPASNTKSVPDKLGFLDALGPFNVPSFLSSSTKSEVKVLPTLKAPEPEPSQKQPGPAEVRPEPQVLSDERRAVSKLTDDGQVSIVSLNVFLEAWRQTLSKEIRLPASFFPGYSKEAIESLFWAFAVKKGTTASTYRDDDMCPIMVFTSLRAPQAKGIRLHRTSHAHHAELELSMVHVAKNISRNESLMYRLDALDRPQLFDLPVIGTVVFTTSFSPVHGPLSMSELNTMVNQMKAVK